MGLVTAPRRFDVHLIQLDPAIGAEMSKARPCVIVSPDVMNRNLTTVIVAPMTSRVRRYPNRVRQTFQGRSGEIALDQIRTVDRSRLIRRLGALDRPTAETVSERLVSMFTL
jgi:mRNA interferase MazF